VGIIVIPLAYRRVYLWPLLFRFGALAVTLFLIYRIKLLRVVQALDFDSSNFVIVIVRVELSGVSFVEDIEYVLVRMRGKVDNAPLALIKNVQKADLVTQERELHSLLQKALLPLAVSYLPLIGILDLLDPLNFLLAHVVNILVLN